MLLALVALLIASGAMLALPVAVRYLIDHGMAAGDASTINRYFLGFLAAAVVFGVFAALRYYLVTWLGERVVSDIRDGRIPARVADGHDLLRGHAHRRSPVAAHHRHDAGAVDLRRRHLHRAAFGAEPGGRAGDDGR